MINSIIEFKKKCFFLLTSNNWEVFMKKPRSLVTGACGFIGSHMVEVLHEAGHEVIATDLESAFQQDDPKTGRFPGIIKKLDVEFKPSDMTRPSTLKPLIKDVEYVFHIASIFNYSAPWHVLYRVNVQGTKDLCQMLLGVKTLKRFVQWGAGGVYGPPEPDQLPITEDMPPVPINNYLKSKWYQEYHVMTLGRKHNFPFSSIRPTTVYGPRGVYGGGQMLMDVAKMKVNIAPINFTARIPFIHVKDVCRAALHVAQNDAGLGEVFNINDDSTMTMYEYFKFMAEENGNLFLPGPPIYLPPIKAILMNFARVMQTFSGLLGINPKLEADSVAYLGVDFVYSNEKLKNTGFKFLYPDARDGIKDTLKWYRKEGWL